MTEVVSGSAIRISHETVGLPNVVDTATGPIAQQDTRRDRRRRIRASRQTSRWSRSRLLNGRYALGPALGAGGMGTVHRAVDHRLGRTVAIKLLHEGRLGTDGFRRRLAAEAAIAASLHHPSVAQVYDYDEGSSRDHAPFVVLEFIDGVTLAQYVRRHGPLSVSQTLAVVHQIAGALAHLEAHGVVHRDLKPANVMLATDGRVVLLDFGIARAPSSETLTTTGAILGTVEFVSPEVIGGEPATRACDLYALGLIVHHCLTGESPFKRSSPIVSAFAQIHDPAPDLPVTVPGPIRELVASLVAKEPSLRPASALDVLAAIERHAVGTDLPVVTGDDVAEVLSLVASAEDDRSPGRRSSGRGLVAAAVMVTACLMTNSMHVGAPAVGAGEDRVAEVEPAPQLDLVQVSDAPVDAPESAAVPTAAVVEPRNSNGVRNSNGKASSNNRQANGNGNGNGNANGKANRGGKG